MASVNIAPTSGLRSTNVVARSVPWSQKLGILELDLNNLALVAPGESQATSTRVLTVNVCFQSLTYEQALTTLSL